MSVVVREIKDELALKIRDDLKPIVELVKKLEEYVEKNVIPLNKKELDELEVDSLIEAVDTIEEKYSEILEELLPMVGEVAILNDVSKENLKKLDKLKEKLEELRWHLGKLSDLLKRTNNGADDIKAEELIENFIQNSNSIVKDIYNFLTQEIYEIIEALKKDMEVLERFYE